MPKVRCCVPEKKMQDVPHTTLVHHARNVNASFVPYLDSDDSDE